MLLLLALSAHAAAPIGSAYVVLDRPEQRAALAQWPVGFAESADANRVLIHGDPATFAAMQRAGFVLSEVRGDHRQRPPPDDGAYHDAQAVEDELWALAERYPDRCALVEIGQSLEGRPILSLEMGPADAPLWSLVGGIHGDEPVSTELALQVARGLLSDAPPLDGLLETRRIRLIPTLNPDGLDAGSRYNGAEVDLNRNFGYHWSPYAFGAGAVPFSEPESAALRTRGEWWPAAGSLMLHAGSTNIGYVWNWTAEPTPEDSFLADLGQLYADTNADPDFWVTRGADWYITTGDATDWSFGRAGTLDFTVELSADKVPSAEDLPRILDAHDDAVAALLRQPMGLSGRVVDAASGRPIPATLTMDGASASLNNPVSGAFFRLVPPDGAATLTVSAPGYRPQSLSVSPSGDPLELALEATSLLTLRPEPALLRNAAGPVAVALPGAGPLDPVVVLRRHGYADVVVETDDEALLVDPSLLLPGAWTIDLGDRVLPRALLVGADSAALRIDALELEDDALALSGEGFAVGSAVFALVGEERAWLSLPILQEDESGLLADLSDLARGEGTVDLVVLSRGQQVPILDLFGEPMIDEGPPDSSVDSTPPCDSPRERGCHGAPGAPSPLALLFALFLGSRRCRA